MRPRCVQCVERVRIDAVGVARRCARGDVIDASDLRGPHAHDRRGHQRKLAAGHVAAHARDRNHLLPEHDARLDLGLEALERIELAPREFRNLLQPVLEVGLERFGQFTLDLADLIHRHLEFARFPLVELARVFADRGVAVFLHVGQHAPHGFLQPGAILRCGWRGFLDVVAHVESPWRNGAGRHCGSPAGERCGQRRQPRRLNRPGTHCQRIAFYHRHRPADRDLNDEFDCPARMLASGRLQRRDR